MLLTAHPLPFHAQEMMKFNEPGREIAMKSNQSISSLRARTWKGAIDVLSLQRGDERREGKPSVSVHASLLTSGDSSLFYFSLLPRGFRKISQKVLIEEASSKVISSDNSCKVPFLHSPRLRFRLEVTFLL